MKIIKKILWVGFLLFILATVFVLGYYVAVTKNVALDPQKLVLSEKNVVVYDQDSEPVKGVSAISRAQTVSIKDVPQHVKDAFVSTEDKRFYKHGGFDMLRIGRAVLNNVKAGAFKEGASTISQQLIKNTHLSQEKTVKRKLQEWKLTRQLEKRYEKDEILEKYLNTIYFGHSCFGIVAAADFYFQKTPSELTLSDGAILAGLVKSPNNYSPFKNPDRCQKRKESVLALMQANGKITENQRQTALGEPLPTRGVSFCNTGFLHFVFDELTDLSARCGFTVGGNVEIETYLDQALQTELEELAKNHTETDKTIMVLDNERRLFKGCVSSVGNIERLPGSLIKPLLVYAPALEENLLSPATPILDEKINYGGYAPENYGGAYHGYVSMREAVEKSLNVPAVKTLESVGIERAAKYMEGLRLPVEREDYSLALALGGMKNGFSLSDVSAAYSALANGGVFQPCGFIAKIKINGETVYQKSEEKTQVFSAQTAYLMSDVLKTTATNGTAKKLRSLPCEIAAKTGTVGTVNGNTDAYALSYTAKDLVSVWLGNADNSKIEYTGGGLPCSFLLGINEYLCNHLTAKSIPQPKFLRPDGVKEIALDKTAYQQNHTLTLADDAAPSAYVFKELFKESAIPLNKSTSFSNPTITSPSLNVKNGVVHIVFDERTPQYYRYKIERTDDKKGVVLYDGNALKEFTDDTIEMNKRYIYTVTPIYENNVGKSITLPAVSTQENENHTEKEEEMLGKNWWEY
ncbi:MAG: transglycosylase domain-containing protein [Clostridia bacterium]|nr:transglycosylase domain-containing protein [Clostridia bacterium]